MPQPLKIVSLPLTTAISLGRVIKIVHPKSSITGTGILKGTISNDYSETVVSSADMTADAGSISAGFKAFNYVVPESINPL